MSPEQFANAKNASGHHGSSTKVTGVAVQSKKDSEVQLMKNQVSYLPESQQEKLITNKFLLHNILDVPNNAAHHKKERN